MKLSFFHFWLEHRRDFTEVSLGPLLTRFEFFYVLSTLCLGNRSKKDQPLEDRSPTSLLVSDLLKPRIHPISQDHVHDRPFEVTYTPDLPKSRVRLISQDHVYARSPKITYMPDLLRSHVQSTSRSASNARSPEARASAKDSLKADLIRTQPVKIIQPWLLCQVILSPDLRRDYFGAVYGTPKLRHWDGRHQRTFE